MMWKTCVGFQNGNEFYTNIVYIALMLVNVGRSVFTTWTIFCLILKQSFLIKIFLKVIAIQGCIANRNRTGNEYIS